MKTFDEWYATTNGIGFDEENLKEGTLISDYFKKLSGAVRDYVTYVAHESQRVHN